MTSNEDPQQRDHRGRGNRLGPRSLNQRATENHQRLADISQRGEGWRRRKVAADARRARIVACQAAQSVAPNEADTVGDVAIAAPARCRHVRPPPPATSASAWGHSLIYAGGVPPLRAYPRAACWWLRWAVLAIVAIIGGVGGWDPARQGLEMRAHRAKWWWLLAAVAAAGASMRFAQIQRPC